MKNIWNTIQGALTAVGAFLGWYLGGMDGVLTALIIFVIVDYLTGVACAVSEGKLSSQVGGKGIAKKVLIFALVGLANIIDLKIIGDGSAIRTAVIFFYLSNEGISILENAAEFGLPVPKKLKDILAQLGKDEENGVAERE